MSYFDIITSHIPEENRGARDGGGLEHVRMYKIGMWGRKGYHVKSGIKKRRMEAKLFD